MLVCRKGTVNEIVVFTYLLTWCLILVKNDRRTANTEVSAINLRHDVKRIGNLFFFPAWVFKHSAENSPRLIRQTRTTKNDHVNFSAVQPFSRCIRVEIFFLFAEIFFSFQTVGVTMSLSFLLFLFIVYNGHARV